jgi:hypothetical protein
VHDARTYVALAEKRNGPIPDAADYRYIWGDAIGISKFSQLRAVAASRQHCHKRRFLATEGSSLPDASGERRVVESGWDQLLHLSNNPSSTAFADYWRPRKCCSGRH